MFRTHIKRISHRYNQLSNRERNIVAIAGFFALVALIRFPIVVGGEYLDEKDRQIAKRELELKTIIPSLIAYNELNSRLAHIRSIYEKSQMSFEEVSRNLDTIIRSSIGSDNYDLTKSGEGKAIGEGYEKQDFALRIRSLTLEQLIKLLYNLEQGNSPLFLGKVDISKTVRSEEFRADLEISSIRRSTGT